MLISTATARALDDIAIRERDVMHAFTPGAVPERSDVARTGGAQFSLDPLSVAAPEGAYFVCTDERGRQCYTRDGGFAFRGGALVDRDGRAILGYREAGAPLGPLSADPVDAALGLTGDVRVEADGSVTYRRATIDPRSGRREMQVTTLGRVALARFAAATKLQAVDATRMVAPAGIAPHLGLPGDGNFGELHAFARERSGIDIDRGLKRLQESYLALDALHGAQLARDRVRKTAMDLLK